jgi:ABC-type Fe3+/spermidine/putrescine transport system ATPase subunit
LGLAEGTAGATVARDAGTARPLVRLAGLSKRYGAVEAVRPLDLSIYPGDFFAILGPSGCGKTTLLRMIGGFIAPTTGTIEIGGADVTRLGPERRPTNMVFQGYGLFPHMNVRQNIAYGLRIANTPTAELEERVAAMLSLGRLAELAGRGVHELSGGQQQRVALARALIMRPKVLLLDEPLGALDLKLRQAMQEELRRLHRQIGGTFVFVTHDQGEALALANRIAIMESGSLVQEGGPEEVYSRPRTRFVSTFIGAANVLPGRRAGGTVTLAAGPTFVEAGPDGAVVAVVRPEAVGIGAGHLASDVRLLGRLVDIVFLGSFVRYLVRLDGGAEIVAHSTDLRLRRTLAVGQEVDIGWSFEDQRVLEDG